MLALKWLDTLKVLMLVGLMVYYSLDALLAVHLECLMAVDLESVWEFEKVANLGYTLVVNLEQLKEQ